MRYPYENLKDLTLASIIDRSAELFGDRDALTKVSQTPMTYTEFFESTMQMVKLMQEKGVSKGDKVALLSESMPNWAVAYFSVTYIGAVIVRACSSYSPSVQSKVYWWV